MEKEWLCLIAILLVAIVILIVSIYHIARWYRKVKSGEIVLPTPTPYYKEHPEEFSIEHTYSIMKSPMGQNILKKNRQRIFATICLFGVGMLAIYFSPQWSKWLEKRIPFASEPLFVFLFGVVFMVSVFVAYLKFKTSEDKKVWVCPYCKMPLMRVELSSKESWEYWDNPKAIFMSHRWGRRNLLLVADHCPHCKKSLIDSDTAAPYDEDGTFEK